MSNDSVTVRSSQSWFGRIGGAIAGVLLGIILFIASFPVLGWNEGRAIHRAQTLDAGAKQVVSVSAVPIDTANQGKLIHITGETTAEGPVSDTVFNITAPAIKLRRTVEMYQWTEDKKSETQKKVGGGEETVTTYSYSKRWVSGLVDSSEFQKSEGHQNPGEMPFEGLTFTADGIKAGDFSLPESLVDKINDFHDLSVKKDTEIDASQFSAPVEITGGGFYIGEDSKKPVIGDLKVTFEVIDPGTVSIVAGQNGETFEPFLIGDDSIELLQTGTFSAASMFATEQQGNAIVTWILRIVGFFMMFIGLLLVAKPISVFADVIPFVGNLAEFGIGLLAFTIALPLSLFTIALAWLAFRPLIGIPLVVVAIACLIFGVRALLKKRAMKRAAVLTPPPMP